MNHGFSIVTVVGALPADSLAGVLRLLVDATRHDGVRPLSEHANLHLRHGGDSGVTHALAHDGNRMCGYLHLDTTDVVQGPSAELVVAPSCRKQGVGSALLATAIQLVDAQPLRLWAHGDSAEAHAFAAARGFVRQRRLLQMRRSLYAPLPKALLPSGITVRGFRPGEDDESWLALNAEAFAGLPDQSNWTMRDLQIRLAEPWFSAEGLLVAVGDQGRFVGTHWTKTHGAADHADHVHEPIGEVYVLGVADSARGTGLGRALTILGLEHLRDLGLGAVMLYVDAANQPAIRVYEGLGFTQWDSDVLYRSNR